MASVTTDARAVPTAPPAARTLRWAIVASLWLLLVRLYVALQIGLGDAEALYVSYALHPQPAYLDHPGLIGMFARWMAPMGESASPVAVHVFTSLGATLVPWVGGAAARAAGAAPRGVAFTVLALLLVPELSLGLFAFSPDLPLALFWLSALGLAAIALRQPPASFSALMATLGCGVCIGLSMLSKVTGVLLGISVLVAFLSAPARSRWRTLGPWAALAVGLVLVLPVVIWELQRGLPLLQHRLVTTQAEAGLSLRNVAALVGGQLLYITPPFLVVVVSLVRRLFRERGTDAISRLLWLSTCFPAAVLIPLCLWSRVAEPHWLAPAYLASAIELGRHPELVGRRLARVCVATGIGVVVLAWAWITTPLPIQLLGSAYRPRYDLANDLHTWGPGRRLVQEAVADAMVQTRRLPVVVGPHWTVCAQVHAALGARVPVGCSSPLPDDFDIWLPPQRWHEAPTIVFVTDDRFDVEPQVLFPDRAVTAVDRAEVRRGDDVVRTVRVVRLDKVSGFSALPRSETTSSAR